MMKGLNVMLVCLIHVFQMSDVAHMSRTNWWVQHATKMFQQHGENVTLYYEAPMSVASLSFLPALINEPEIIVAGLRAQGSIFSHIPRELPEIPWRTFQYSVTTPGLCFCCKHTGGWDNLIRGYQAAKLLFPDLHNYSHCTEKFWLWGKNNISYRFNFKANESSLNEIYPSLELPKPNLDTITSGSYCAGWQIKDPNLWFFFDKWANNYHPGNCQCVGVGYLTFPVQVVKAPDPNTLLRRKRSAVFGALGPTCDDTVIIDRHISSNDGEIIAGGLLTGLLTLGAYPGVLTQINRKSILGLTCRLERSINATGKIIRLLQLEINNLNQLIVQHRIALDYLLAREGGFCEIVKDGCKVTFQDLNHTIEGHLQDMTSMIHNNVGTDTDYFAWLVDWLPNLSWLRMVCIFIFIFVFALIMICCGMQCLPFCVQGLKALIPRKSTVSLMVLNSFHSAPTPQ